MRYVIPDYYREFQCTASACEDTCCAGWEIVIDQATMKKYNKVKGAFGNRLHNGICRKTPSFRQHKRRCEFLNENNLCDIYCELGPGLLCKTCRTYPRHIEEFEGLREISLSLSCPEAARLILSRRDPVRYLRRERKGEEEYEEFDFLLFNQLMDTRDVMLEILGESNSSVSLGMVLALAHDLQGRIRRNELFTVDNLLKRYSRPSSPPSFQKKLSQWAGQPEKRYGILRKMFGALSRLEVLREDWPGFLKEVQTTLYEKGPQVYAGNRTEFLSAVQLDEETQVSWDRHWKQLAEYFIFTYFCGAVYDGNGFGKIKLAVVSTLWIQEMVQAVWLQNGKKAGFSDLTCIAGRFSRELEHSDDNLETIEKILTRDPLFSLENILICTVN